MKILITGSNGFIGSNLKYYLSDHDIVSLNRSIFDLRSSEETDIFFNNSDYFDVVIHTAVKGGNRLQIDRPEVVFDNLSMIMNLLKNKNKFNKLINFSSGAELDRRQNIDEKSKNIFESFPVDYYGFSKNIISRLLYYYDNVYNLRIFNVFDKNEESRRMIKSNIQNYIDRKPIKIHQDRIMDFFYIEDLVKVVEYYINNNKCPKTINCCYEKKYSLYDIAKIINSLGQYSVNINIEKEGMAEAYYGEFNLMKIPIELNTLEDSIKKTYYSIKNNYA